MQRLRSQIMEHFCDGLSLQALPLQLCLLFRCISCMLHHLDNRSKGKRFVGSKFCEYLPVEFNARVLVGTHELRITPRILSNSCLNPLNPKFRPFTTFPAAIAISVLPRFLQPTNCHSKAIFGTTSKTLGLLQYILVLFRSESSGNRQRVRGREKRKFDLFSTGAIARRS